MSKTIEFNLNRYIQVQLTNKGRAELKRQHDALYQDIPGAHEYHPPKEDADGWSRWQAWCLFQVLGAELGWNSKLMFATTIRIEVDS